MFIIYLVSKLSMNILSINNLPSYEQFDLVPNCIVSFGFLTVLLLYVQTHHSYPKNFYIVNNLMYTKVDFKFIHTP